MHYKLRFDRSNYLVGDISLKEVGAKLGNPFALDAPLWKDIWQPLHIQFRDDSDKQNVATPPDITCWFTNELILNEKAYEAIGSHLEPYGELLPAKSEYVSYWVFHVTKRLGMDVIDETMSERIVEDGGYIDLKKLTFKNEMIKDTLLFKTAYSGYQNIYCSNAFKKLTKEHDLKGLVFSTDLVSVV